VPDVPAIFDHVVVSRSPRCGTIAGRAQRRRPAEQFQVIAYLIPEASWSTSWAFKTASRAVFAVAS
jgi:hypothetical protein